MIEITLGSNPIIKIKDHKPIIKFNGLIQLLKKIKDKLAILLNFRVQLKNFDYIL